MCSVFYPTTIIMSLSLEEIDRDFQKACANQFDIQTRILNFQAQLERVIPHAQHLLATSSTSTSSISKIESNIEILKTIFSDLLNYFEQQLKDNKTIIKNQEIIIKELNQVNSQ